jgi:PLP dependent protein
VSDLGPPAAGGDAAARHAGDAHAGDAHAGTGEALADAVARRLVDVRERIARAGADPGAVTVVAVTKGFGPEAVAAATAAGLSDVGENYAQELLAKAPQAPPGIRWHFLGEVQRNKLNRLAGLVHLWQGLDSPARASALARKAPGAGVLVQVKVQDSAGRHGATLSEVPELVGEAARAGLDVQGLMAVGPQGGKGAREAFAGVAALARRLSLPVISMGMSNDFELAVAQGATMVRLGRALFGPRPPVQAPGAGTVKLRW